MLHEPSQPVDLSVGARPVSFNKVEFTMPRPEPTRRAEVLEMLLSAVGGVFPGPVLEALIARLEAGK